MRTILFCLTFLVLAPFVSCKRTGHASLKGAVTETGTGAPIQGATVILQYWKDCTMCPYQFDSTYTDSEGRFAWYFKKEVNHQYRLSVRDNRHYGYGDAIVSERVNNNWQVSLDAFAYLKFHIKKAGASNRALNIDNAYHGIRLYYSHNGSPADTVLPVVFRVRAYQALGFDWNILQSYPDPVEKTSIHATATIAKGDTLVYTLQYN